MLLSVILTGCSTLRVPEVKPTPVVVIPIEPQWATKEITDDMPLGEVAKRYKIFRIQALGYIEELKTIIKPIEKKEEPNGKQ